MVIITKDGLQSAAPEAIIRATLPQASSGRKKTSRSGGSRGKSYKNVPSTPSVKLGDIPGTVIINGQGYSVAAANLPEFILSKTGGLGDSAKAAIEKARQIAEEEARKIAAQNKIKELERIKQFNQKIASITKQTPMQKELFERARKQNLLISSLNKNNNLSASSITKTQNLGVSKNKSVLNSAITISKFIGSSLRGIPNVLKDMGISLAKGVYKVPLYAIDNAGYVSSLKWDSRNNRVYVPAGTVALTDNKYFKLGKVKKWADYNYKTNPLRDPDYQNVTIATAFTLLGITSPTAARSVFGAVKGKAVYDFVKNPTTENLTNIEILFGPEAIIGLKKPLSRVVSPRISATTSGEYVLRGTNKKAVKLPRAYESVTDFLKGKVSNKFKSAIKSSEIKLKKQTVSSGAMPFEEQLRKYSGKKATIVNAAADQLTGWIKRNRIIRKPIPNENKAPIEIKKILNKLDDGVNLKLNEIVKANKWLQKVTGDKSKTILERSLYGDPDAGLRTSRLGIAKERSPNLKELLRGNYDISFRGKKPQVLIFEDAIIERSPKNIQSIFKKLKKSSEVSDLDLAKLIKWQLKKTGKFKAGGSPRYSGGKELEVTLAPGEMIKRNKELGHTYIDGKKITFVSAEVYTPPKQTISKIKLAEQGKLSKFEVKKLNSRLSKDVGYKVQVETPDILRKGIVKSRRGNMPVVRVSLNRIVVSSLGLSRTPSRRTPTRRTPVVITSGFTKRKLKMSKPTYYVKIRRKGKIINLTPRPLLLEDAKDFLAYSIDNGLERSAWLEPIGKSDKIVKPPKNMAGYFKQNSRKLRPYKINFGKKLGIRNGYIEKRRYLIDTKREKMQIRKSRRKISPQQKKVLLKRLEKARRVRLNKIKRIRKV